MRFPFVLAAFHILFVIVIHGIIKIIISVENVYIKVPNETIKINGITVDGNSGFGGVDGPFQWDEIAHKSNL